MQLPFRHDHHPAVAYQSLRLFGEKMDGIQGWGASLGEVAIVISMVGTGA